MRVLGVLMAPVAAAMMVMAGLACAEPEAAREWEPPEYQKLRYDEDYGYLRDPEKRTDFWDPVKYIPLTEEGDWRLSVGGEARLRYEWYNNFKWNANAADEDGYLLQRYLLHADLKMGAAFRVFGQVQSSLEDWRAGGPRGTDEDRVDLHQAFADVRVPLGDLNDAVTFRLGRQEMMYGSQRLISVRESPNNRRAFDGARALAEFGAWKVDAFLVRPVEVDRGAFDDAGEGQTNFWGVYATGPGLWRGGSIDVYYLGLRAPGVEYVSGVANELRHTVGTRVFGREGAFDSNVEAALQWGTFGEREILAWTVGSEVGVTFSGAPMTPRLSLKANAISGDTGPSGGRLGTFNAMFPRGSYFGEISLIGPANLLNLHPTLELHATPEITVTADWAFFWRASVSDGLYDNGGNITRAGGEGRFIGHQASLGAEWKAGRHTTVNATYARFFTGDGLADGADVDFVGAWVTYKF